MTRARDSARIHLFPAKDVPLCVILRRKPTRWFHVMLWNTQTDEIEHGSWFQGRIYPDHCDLSPDGKWMFYFARDHKDHGTWSAICKPPWLKALVYWMDCGWHNTGAFWPSSDLLEADFDLRLPKAEGELPFEIKRLPINSEAERYKAATLCRLRRDGWQPEPSFTAWRRKPSDNHPTLTLTFDTDDLSEPSFQLEGSAVLLDDVDAATFDSFGQLLVARNGAVERYSLSGLQTGSADSAIDLEHLTVPPERANYRPPYAVVDSEDRSHQPKGLRRLIRKIRRAFEDVSARVSDESLTDGETDHLAGFTWQDVISGARYPHEVSYLSTRDLAILLPGYLITNLRDIDSAHAEVLEGVLVPGSSRFKQDLKSMLNEQQQGVVADWLRFRQMAYYISVGTVNPWGHIAPEYKKEIYLQDVIEYWSTADGAPE
jgi:hypothetical protein